MKSQQDAEHAGGQRSGDRPPRKTVKGQRTIDPVHEQTEQRRRVDDGDGGDPEDKVGVRHAGHSCNRPERRARRHDTDKAQGSRKGAACDGRPDASGRQQQQLQHRPYGGGQIEVGGWRERPTGRKTRAGFNRGPERVAQSRERRRHRRCLDGRVGRQKPDDVREVPARTGTQLLEKRKRPQHHEDPDRRVDRECSRWRVGFTLHAIRAPTEDPAPPGVEQGRRGGDGCGAWSQADMRLGDEGRDQHNPGKNGDGPACEACTQYKQQGKGKNRDMGVPGARQQVSEPQERARAWPEEIDGHRDDEAQAERPATVSPHENDGCDDRRQIQRQHGPVQAEFVAGQGV